MGLSLACILNRSSKSLKQIFIVLLVLLGVANQPICGAHDGLNDRVSIITHQGQLFGITSREGIARQVLGAGEQIVEIDSQGVTGFVQTTTRLLGFSGKLQRWIPLTLSSSEHIIKWSLSPRLIIVQGQQAVYGFQSDSGRWKREPLGAGEIFRSSAVKNAVAIVVTDRRALGLSAKTGGFFLQDLPAGDHIRNIQINDHIVLLYLSDSILVFRSGLGIWAELP